MNTGGETASIILGFIAEINKENFRIGGELLKFLIMNSMGKNKEHLNTGKTNMKKIIESGDDIKMMDLNNDDAKIFSKRAKKAGISFAVLHKGEEMQTVAYKVKEAEIVQRILEKMDDNKRKGINEEVDDSILDEFRIDGEKTYIVDKDNPENYVAADYKEIQKTYIVDKDNPNNKISITENPKENILEAEITIDGQSKTISNKDTTISKISKEIIKNAKKFKNSDIAYSKDEINKIKEDSKDKVNDDHNRKTIKEVEKQIQEVREKQPKQPKKDKSKTKERGQR